MRQAGDITNKKKFEKGPQLYTLDEKKEKKRGVSERQRPSLVTACLKSRHSFCQYFRRVVAKEGRNATCRRSFAPLRRKEAGEGQVAAFVHRICSIIQIHKGQSLQIQTFFSEER